jgi:Integrase core domain
VPAEVLSDNGKQFTGRFGKPRPAEVLFGRICRENGITQRLTRPRSPTTTGKIERLHQTLQEELLTVHDPFETIEDAQAAVDAWRQDYNADRPHQSLNMAFPAARFVPATGEILGLRIPAELTTSRPVRLAEPADVPPPANPALPPVPDAESLPRALAVEAGRMVPPSGNLWIAGQQIWLGPPCAAAPPGCGPGWTTFMSCSTATGSKPCRPGSTAVTWPGSSPTVPSLRARRRCRRLLAA